MKVTVNWEALGKALWEAVKPVPLGALALPTREVRSPYTEGLTSLHGKTGFAAHSVIAPYHLGRKRRGNPNNKTTKKETRK
jgi:hypothetical protein